MCTLQSACTFRRNVGSLLFVPFILPQHDTIVQLDARRDETRRELHGSSTEFHRPSSNLAAQPCSGSGKNEGQMYCVHMVVPSISNSPTCTMAMTKLHRFRLNSPNLSPSAHARGRLHPSATALLNNTDSSSEFSHKCGGGSQHLFNPHLARSSYPGNFLWYLEGSVKRNSAHS